jgi:SpoVK/Ycf46/Vps4 family AAA+-type ATPase
MILSLELLKRPHEDIDTARIVELTKGYSSSDISFIVKECARCSFDESIKAKHLVKIDQPLLEKTIAGTRPSVTADELRQFERTKESFSGGQKNERPRIGFVK